MAFPAFLAPLIKPFLTGAATGGVLGLATGKDPLKSALMGGVMGGIGSKIAGAEAVSGVGSSTGGVSGVGTVPVNSGSFMTPTMPETGMFNSFNTATNAPMGNPAASIVGSTGEMAPNMGLVQTMTQGVQDFSPLMTRGGASAGGLSVDPAASGFSRFLDGLPDYVTPQNVLGAANILAQSQPQQMPMPTSSARVSRGTPRQGAIDYGMAQPIKRRGLL
jgi:hypothetical protein